MFRSYLFFAVFFLLIFVLGMGAQFVDNSGQRSIARAVPIADSPGPQKVVAEALESRPKEDRRTESQNIEKMTARNTLLIEPIPAEK